MGVSIIGAASTTSSKTRYAVTLTSGTSWTVPAGVTYVNVTLVGGGGGGGGSSGTGQGGAGGTGGTTTFTGATSALGGVGMNVSLALTTYWSAVNGLSATANTGQGGWSAVTVGSNSNAGYLPAPNSGLQAGSGQVITSTLATTPGAGITYAIGAGGTGGTAGTGGGVVGGTGGSGRIDIEYWL